MKVPLVIKQYFTRRMLIMLLMSFSSGLPLALVGSTLQAWYTVSGVGIVSIGFLTLVGQPYAYKFIWAPIMDRFSLPFLGRRRGWILLTQLLLAMSIFLMSAFSPKVQPLGLAIVALLVAFLSASQDINLDAYRTDLLTSKERGVGSAMWANGYRIAMVVSGALALVIADKYGWRVTYISMSILMIIGIVTTFFCSEPKTEHGPPSSLKEASFGAMQEFFKRRNAMLILLFIVIYKLGDAFALSLSSVFYLRGLGFSLEQVAWVGKTFGIIAGILGIILGGALMSKWSIYKALMIFGWLQALSTLMFFWLALVGKSMILFASSVFIEHITSGMGTAAILAFLMQLCDQRYSATHYALLSAVVSIGRIFVGPAAGIMIKNIGWAEFFVYSFVIGVLGLGLLRMIKESIYPSEMKIREL